MDLLPILYMMCWSRQKQSLAFSLLLFTTILSTNLFIQQSLVSDTTSEDDAAHQLQKSDDGQILETDTLDAPSKNNVRSWLPNPIFEKLDSLSYPDNAAARVYNALYPLDPRYKDDVAPPEDPAPRVTVLMPCHGQAKYLHDALASLLNQTYPFWELAILDDGSSDGCAAEALAILAAYFPDGGIQHQRHTSSYLHVVNATANNEDASSVQHSHRLKRVLSQFGNFTFDTYDLDTAFTFSSPAVSTSAFDRGYAARPLHPMVTSSWRAGHAPHIRVYKHANLGLAAARNFALFHTTVFPQRGNGYAHIYAHPAATWVCLLDADDALHPWYLELAVRHAWAADPTLQLITSGQQFFGESRNTWASVPYLWDKQTALAYGPLPISTLVRRARLLELTTAWPAHLPYGNEDWTAWIGLLWLPGVRVGRIEKHHVHVMLRELEDALASVHRDVPGRRVWQAEMLDVAAMSHLGRPQPGNAVDLPRKDMFEAGVVPRVPRPVFPTNTGPHFLRYRWKRQSMQRSKEHLKHVHLPMMRTLLPHLYGPSQILQDHTTLREKLTAAVANKILEAIQRFAPAAHLLSSRGKGMAFDTLTALETFPLEESMGMETLGVEEEDLPDLNLTPLYCGNAGEAALWMGLYYEGLGRNATEAKRWYMLGLLQRERSFVAEDRILTNQSASTRMETLRTAAEQRHRSSDVAGGAGDADWQLWWRLGTLRGEEGDVADAQRFCGKAIHFAGPRLRPFANY